jgi:RsiW-degrading membrane proteinase PrsW (M82 family)
MLAQASQDTGFVISLVVIVALIYLLILRLMDMNEKEPSWALGLTLVLGGLAAVIVRALIEVETRSGFGVAVLGAVTKFVALAVALAIVAAAGRARGVREFQGLVDGLVYGAAVGLGFAVGETLIRELSTASAVALAGGRIDLLWTTVLGGLSEGLFGAIIGIGFGLAAGSRSRGAAAVAVLAGLVAGVLVEWGYGLLAFGSLGSQSVARSWIALLLPAVLVVVVAAAALARERRAIREELPAERDSGVVTDEDLRLLPSFTARRASYARLFFRGDFDAWLALRELHSRQVQLALAKQRAARRPNGREEAEVEIGRLRAAIAGAREEAEARRGPSMLGRGRE